jgi:hypothetical protein
MENRSTGADRREREKRRKLPSGIEEASHLTVVGAIQAHRQLVDAMSR